MDTHILELVRKNYPQIAEKKLQEEIATVGKLVFIKERKIIIYFTSILV